MAKRIDQRIQEMFTKKFRMAPASLHSNFREMPGWDSLRHAEFIIALQNEFKIRLYPNEIAAIQSLDAAIRIVSEKLSSNET